MILGSLAVAMCSFGISCSKTVEKPPVEKKVSENVIYLGDDLKLTLDDYDRCLEVHRFMGRDYSARALANPRFQRDEISRCAQSAMMRNFVKKEKFEPTAADRSAAIQRAMERNGVQSEEKLIEKLGIKPSDFHDIVFDAVLPKMMQRAIVSSLSEEEKSALFKVDNTVYKFEILDFANEPTQDEIELFVESGDELMQTYLERHPELIVSKPRARFVRLAYAQTGGTQDAIGHQQAEALRLHAVHNGVDAALERCAEEAKFGCVVLNDKSNLYEVERSKETAWAFRIPYGGVSDLIHTPVQTEIWILQETVPPQKQNLGDPKIRRRVGTEILRKYQASPHLLMDIKTALEDKDPDLRAIARQFNGQYREFREAKLIDLTDQQKIESDQVLALLRTTPNEAAGLFANPIIENERMYIVRIDEVNPPAPDAYETEKSAWIERKSADPNLELVNVWLQNHMPTMSTIDIKPIQHQYGVLQPNGSIR